MKDDQLQREVANKGRTGNGGVGEMYPLLSSTNTQEG